VQILIDTVFVVLQSGDARQLSAEQLRAAEQKAKRALLENWEAQLDSSLATAAAAAHGEAEAAPKHAEEDKKNSSLAAAILEKLEVRGCTHKVLVAVGVPVVLLMALGGQSATDGTGATTI